MVSSKRASTRFSVAMPGRCTVRNRKCSNVNACVSNVVGISYKSRPSLERSPSPPTWRKTLPDPALRECQPSTEHQTLNGPLLASARHVRTNNVASGELEESVVGVCLPQGLLAVDICGSKNAFSCPLIFLVFSPLPKCSSHRHRYPF